MRGPQDTSLWGYGDASGVLAESWETLAKLLKGLNSKFLLLPQCESSKKPLEDGTTPRGLGAVPQRCPRAQTQPGVARGVLWMLLPPLAAFHSSFVVPGRTSGAPVLQEGGEAFFWGVLSVFLNSSSGVTLMEGGITGPSPCPVSVNCLQDFPLSPTFPVQLFFHSRLPYWHDTVGEHCQS